jgi:hypothetical protein
MLPATAEPSANSKRALRDECLAGEVSGNDPDGEMGD